MMYVKISTDKYNVSRLAKDIAAGKIVSSYFELVKSSPRNHHAEEWSRVVEAALLGCPIPRVFCLMHKDGTLEITCGSPMVAALTAFARGEFKLSGLHVLDEYDGMNFQSLPPLEQGKVEDYELTVSWVFEGTPGEVLAALYSYASGNFG